MQQMQNLMKIEIEEEYDDIRIDKVLAAYLTDLSRTYIQKLIEGGNVTLSGKTLKANFKVSTGQEIEVLLPEPETLKVEPENIPLDILYEDSDVIVVNKPKNMVVHPAAGHYSGTLVNALLYHCKDSLSGINGIMRPGIVHRIDKDTTGALVVCKNDIAHQCLAEQLKEHSITRRYEAIVYNTFKETEGRVEGPIGRHPSERTKMAINYKNGKEAITNYRVLENLGTGYAHVECRLETGRTHQIIRYLGIPCMVLQRILLDWKVNLFMQKFWVLFIQAQKNIWNLKRQHRTILQNYFKNSDVNNF